jgi:hypothetical protein
VNAEVLGFILMVSPENPSGISWFIKPMNTNKLFAYHKPK